MLLEKRSRSVKLLPFEIKRNIFCQLCEPSRLKMGSEQSSQPNASSESKNSKLKRGKSVPESSWPRNSQDGQHSSRAASANTSPGHSVCSDVDLPYVSFTVNRPIGDSPKKPSIMTRGRSMQAQSQRSKKSPKNPPKHNIVVVRPAIQVNPDMDEDLSRLKQVSSFLPIIRGTVSLPAARDREALERIDSDAIFRLCQLYQAYMSRCARAVTADQTLINKQISVLDEEATRVLNLYVTSYKHYSKINEQFKCINDMNKQLNACHLLLNKTLDLVQFLNNILPPDERLEPFVWTTG